MPDGNEESFKPVDKMQNRIGMTKLVVGVEAALSNLFGDNTLIFDPHHDHFSPLYQTTANPSILSLLAKYEYGEEAGKKDVTTNWSERWGKIPEQERADLLLLYKAAYASGWEDQPTQKDSHSTQVFINAARYLEGSQMDESSKWNVITEIFAQKQGGMWDAERKNILRKTKQEAELK